MRISELALYKNTFVEILFNDGVDLKGFLEFFDKKDAYIFGFYPNSFRIGDFRFYAKDVKQVTFHSHSLPDDWIPFF